MNMRNKFFFLFLSLLFTFLLPNYANAALNGIEVPKKGKVIICHYPPGNIPNVQNISISVSALNAHLWDGVAGDQHQFDELEVNGICPYAESQKTAAAAVITVATQTLTAAQEDLKTATAEVATATKNLTDAKEDLKKEKEKDNDKKHSQSTKVADLTQKVDIAQTALNTAIDKQNTAQAAVTAAENNLATVESTSGAVVAAVNAVDSEIAAEKENPNPTKITICHVNNPGNGRVEIIDVSTNGWDDGKNTAYSRHESHIDDEIFNPSKPCTSIGSVAPTVDTVDGQTVPQVNPSTPVETTDTTPLITGSVGATRLEKEEPFSVTVNGVIYTEGADLILKANKTWSLQIPETNKLSGGIYEVKATRSGNNDKTSNEFKLIATCVAPKILNRAKTACITTPTVNVNPISAETTTILVPIDGTFGGEPLVDNVGSQENVRVRVGNDFYFRSHQQVVKGAKIYGH